MVQKELLCNACFLAGNFWILKEKEKEFLFNLHWLGILYICDHQLAQL